MDAHAPDAPRTELAINAWASVHLFADVLGELDTIDAAVDRRGARRAGRSTSAWPRRSPWASPDNPLDLPRIFRVTFQVQEVRDGEIVPSGDGEFLDVNDFVSE